MHNPNCWYVRLWLKLASVLLIEIIPRAWTCRHSRWTNARVDDIGERFCFNFTATCVKCHKTQTWSFQ